MLKTERLQNAKNAIKTSIENKGVTVDDGAKLDEYPALINSISGGGGGGSDSDYIAPNFFELRTNGGTNLSYLLYGLNTETIDLSSLDVSKATTADYMFQKCIANITGIENWDFAALENGYRLFYEATNTYMNVSSMKFSKLNRAQGLFYNANIDNLNIENLELPRCKDYTRLLEQADGTKLDLTKWDVSNVTNFTYFMHYCQVKEVDLTGWDTSKATNLSYMFYNTSEVEKLIFPNFTILSTANTSNLFNSYCPKHMVFSNVDDATMTTITSKLSTKGNTEGYIVEVRPDLAQDIIDSLANKGYKPVGPAFTLTGGSLGLELTEILPNGKTTAVIVNMAPWYFNPVYSENVQLISSNESVITVNGDKLISTGQIGSSDITLERVSDDTVLGDPVTLNVTASDSNPRQIKFRVANNPASTTNILDVNYSYIKLNQCTVDNLGIYTYTHGSDITSFDITPSSTCYIGDLIKFNLNATTMTSLREFFRNYKGKRVDISTWDTSHIITFDSMFYDATNLEIIEGEIDMSNASTTQGQYIFHNTINLKEVYLKNIYKNCNINNISFWSLDFSYTQIKDECLVYIINELPDLYARGLTDTSYLKIHLPKNNTLTEEQVAVAINKGWTITNVNY